MGRGRGDAVGAGRGLILGLCCGHYSDLQGLVWSLVSRGHPQDLPHVSGKGLKTPFHLHNPEVLQEFQFTVGVWRKKCFQNPLYNFSDEI